jgi:RNA polymerase primary sigma factor
MFKLNPHLTNQLRKMKKNVAVLEQKLQRNPSIEEIIDSVEIDKESLMGKRLMKLFYTNKINVDGNIQQYFSDIIEDLDSIEELKYKISNVLSKITYREAQVLKMCFGIDEDELTIKEISEKLNMSCDRVRAVKKSGMERFQTIASNKELYLK